MMCGTITYPIAVRIARKVFRLKGFYAIHFAIAPFLAAVHVNIFAGLHAYFRIKIIEKEFERNLRSQKLSVEMQNFIQDRHENVPACDYIHASYYKVKDEVCR